MGNFCPYTCVNEIIYDNDVGCKIVQYIFVGTWRKEVDCPKKVNLSAIKDGVSSTFKTKAWEIDNVILYVA